MDEWTLTVWCTLSDNPGFRYSKIRVERFASKEGVIRFIEDRYLAAKVTWNDERKRCSIVIKG
ncbi:MAG: hypothetical protein E6Z30_05980 [Atopobium minutum]|uniref:hypothetical protein n=1 Tax=Atopobium sp. BV3Ac4 TaxID=1111121 RepID=UPI000550C01A|nr:hypothetical protein [Atopobium sp. BV3Ac4]MDU5356811.1 hypothetical protein [Atopobium minutum]MDU5893360.1 hypothetical protein [Atopobium minutum]